MVIYLYSGNEKTFNINNEISAEVMMIWGFIIFATTFVLNIFQYCLRMMNQFLVKKL
jgi:hypothetical protein